MKILVEIQMKLIKNNGAFLSGKQDSILTELKEQGGVTLNLIIILSASLVVLIACRRLIDKFGVEF